MSAEIADMASTDALVVVVVIFQHAGHATIVCEEVGYASSNPVFLQLQLSL